MSAIIVKDDLMQDRDDTQKIIQITFFDDITEEDIKQEAFFKMSTNRVTVHAFSVVLFYIHVSI